jgi:hypothetical protein
MPITFDEVSVDVREPEARTPAAPPEATAPAGAPDIEERVEKMLRLRGERERRLLAD